MGDRLEVQKTYKLFIGGQFPRSESGRTLPAAVPGGVAHVSRASRKDLREGVTSARRALPAWSGETRAVTPMLRGQILYRMAEMLESRRHEFAELLAAGVPAPRARAPRGRGRSGTGRAGAPRPPGPADEVALTVDRLVRFAGWCDKIGHVLGSLNPVAGPYYSVSSPEPVGVVGVVAPDTPALLGLVSLLAPVVCAGNTAVVLAGERVPAVAPVLGEVCASSDVPGGVINLLTGLRSELCPVLAEHRDVDGIHAAGVDAETAERLRAGSGENLKRVRVHAGVPDWGDAEAWDGAWTIEPFVDVKTIWHPMAT